MPKTMDEVINEALNLQFGEEYVISEPHLRADLAALRIKERKLRARERARQQALFANGILAPRPSVVRSLSALLAEIGEAVSTFLPAVTKRRANRIFRPPGMAIDHFAQFIYSKKTYQNTFKPMIDDHRIEHMEALHAEAHRKAKWIAARCNILTAWSMIAHLPYGAIKLCVDLLKKVAM